MVPSLQHYNQSKQENEGTYHNKKHQIIQLTKVINSYVHYQEHITRNVQLPY